MKEINCIQSFSDLELAQEVHRRMYKKLLPKELRHCKGGWWIGGNKQPVAYVERGNSSGATCTAEGDQRQVVSRINAVDMVCNLLVEIRDVEVEPVELFGLKKG